MLIKHLSLKKILSFNDIEIELGPLNVLIGPNAVGKSNLIEVIGLLQAAPSSILTPILRGGGASQWVWLGDESGYPLASVGCQLQIPELVTYYLQFASTERGFQILKESIAASASPQGSDFNYYMTRAFQEASVRTDVSTQDFQTFVLSPADAFLSQFKNPGDTTPTTRIGNSLSQIRIYREFRSGLQAAARLGASTLAPKDSLADGGDNLALVLQELDFRGVHDQIREYLGRFCERFEDVKVSIGEGLARLFMREAGLREMVAAARLSDGTLKFLSLLVALFHPNKAPLVCIEEPETGLHPDAMRLVAEVLIDASRRTQIIVTTHSEALIDALSDTPESVMVCERGVDLGTQMKRLEKESLMDWLKDYTLGQLWRKGEIGGNSD